MSIVPVDTSNALAVSDYLDKARQWLATAVEMTGPEQIAIAKAEIATAAEATKQLGLSKEIQLDAQEMVRRAEYALGKAIRKGQDDGTISKPHVSRPFRGLDVHHPDIKRLGEFVGKGEWNGSGARDAGINALADTEPADFDAAIDEAKAEGNLSRANVVRKARERSGKPPLTERNFQEAELVTAFRVSVRPLLKPKNVSTLSPRARALLIDLLQEAIDTLKGTDE